MGQYYYVINLTKKEYLHPHKFNDGLKLLEFGASGNGTMTGLAVLLANSNGRGGGDLPISDDYDGEILPGRWAGDKIVVAGDYAEKGDPGETQKTNLHTRCFEGNFRDISTETIKLLCEDSYLKEQLKP